jgi:hypothetical protein
VPLAWEAQSHRKLSVAVGEAPSRGIGVTFDAKPNKQSDQDMLGAVACLSLTCSLS